MRRFDKSDARIVDAMNNLAQALENGDKVNAAVELRGQALKLLDGRDDEKFIHAARAYLKLLESREELDKFWYLENRSEELERVRENVAARLQIRLDTTASATRTAQGKFAKKSPPLKKIFGNCGLNDWVRKILLLSRRKNLETTRQLLKALS